LDEGLYGLYILTLGLLLVELISFPLLIYAVKLIGRRVDGILPPGKPAGEILSEAVFTFMEGVAKDPKRQEAFFGFCGACAIAAWSQVKDNIIPGAKKAEAIGGAIEKVTAKNPWAALLVEGLRIGMPMIQERLGNAENPQARRPARRSDNF